jgi:hypothetical protein
MSEPLISSDSNSGYQPCAKFLLKSDIGEWYEGKIRKKVSVFHNFLEKTAFRSKEQVFISHKFKHTINGLERTFCITFRKDPSTADSFTPLGGRYNNAFLIRLSLIEYTDSTNQVMKCKGRESLVLMPKIFEKDGIEIPTEESAKFSSITSGKTGDQEVEVNMREMYQGINKYKEYFKKHIEPQMQSLGHILVNHCDPIISAASGGGATRNRKRLTRRRKSVFKRKCKKSYRKNKYSKTKKSRKFRRSGRSRR